MTEIRYVQTGDKEFWYGFDKHLPDKEFDNKVRNKRGYKDCGGLMINIPKYEQPMELFMIKSI